MTLLSPRNSVPPEPAEVPHIVPSAQQAGRARVVEFTLIRFPTAAGKEGRDAGTLPPLRVLDVYAKTVVACMIKDGKKQPRTFSMMTADLLALADWLTAAGCTHVAVESTGVYWKPVFNLFVASKHAE